MDTIKEKDDVERGFEGGHDRIFSGFCCVVGTCRQRAADEPFFQA